MRKNKMMRLASGLLVAVLLTTSTISGTFAKYVTSDSASDSARVAKFGVVLQADGKLYGENYGTGVNSVPTTDSTVANLSVDADANAVAPGTQNDKGLNFSVNGTPEVRTQLDVTIECENIYLKQGTYAVMVKAPTVTATSFKADTYYTEAEGVYTLATAYETGKTYYSKEDEVVLSKDYYPVVYSADLTTGTIESDSLNAIAADYAKKLNNNEEVSATQEGNAKDKFKYVITKVYDPNFNYAGLNVAGDSLTWKWEIEQASETTMYNGADTILGDLMAGTLTNAKVVKVGATIKAPEDITDYNLNTNFSISITVTQVD